ncbi:MAG TPA: sulfatase-like hydrolase/transferase [Bryobacteraceae bacterium]|nr:sulfatase-like hydrolase/transferase [Bryobacteraceae bacterium]
MALTRRRFLGTAAVSAAAASAAEGPPPNLVLFMADELRAESIACYGHPLVRTPNIDRFAKAGTRFEQCHVQNPVCEPSRCSFLTGWPVHVRGHRSLYYSLHPDEPNLFRYLKEAGYEVWWFGKNDLLAPDSFAASVTHAEAGPPAGMFTKNPYAADDPRFYTFLWEEGGDPRSTGDYANMQSAARVLQERRRAPVCLFLPLLYPHPPYSAPRGFHNMYRPADIPPLRPASTPKQARFHAALRHRMRLDQVGDDLFRRIHAVYLGQISYFDWVFGEMLAAIDNAGRAQDTYVFLFSDHGDFAGDYGLVEKWPNAMPDVLTRIPLIVRGPGVAAGHTAAGQVELFDVMATCLELAGVRARHRHFAQSLRPQMSGGAGDRNRPVFCEGGYNTSEPWAFEPLDQFADPSNPYYPKVALQNQEPDTVTRSTMIRTLTHKLILRPDDQSELYDFATDPRELHNAYGDSAYQGVQERLTAALADWYVRTSDVAPPERDPRGFPPK